MASGSNLATGHARFGDSTAYFGLILVNLCGVNGAVPGFNCVADRVKGRLSLQAEGAGAKCWDGHSRIPLCVQSGHHCTVATLAEKACFPPKIFDP
jgi:hypothetical protein